MDANEVREIARQESSKDGFSLFIIFLLLASLLAYVGYQDARDIKALQQRVEALEQKK